VATAVVGAYHYELIPVAAEKGSARGRSHDWKLLLVQELCDASLLSAIDSHLLHEQDTNTPCVDLVVSLLRDVADGMVHLHQKGVRDVQAGMSCRCMPLHPAAT
jgi:hypothetical protein